MYTVTGVMLGQFVKDMELRVADILPENMKAFIYSGVSSKFVFHMFNHPPPCMDLNNHFLALQHDSTLWNLVSAMGLYKNQSMPYSTCIMVELHKTGNGSSTKDHVVKMYIRNGITESVEPLILDSKFVVYLILSLII